MGNKLTMEQAKAIIALDECKIFNDTSLLEIELANKNTALLENDEIREILIKSLKGEPWRGRGNKPSREANLWKDDVIEAVAKLLKQGDGITNAFEIVGDKYNKGPDAIRKIWTTHGEADRMALSIKRFYGVEK